MSGERQQMAGLDIVRSMLERDGPFAPIGETLSFDLADVEYGKTRFIGYPNADHLNPAGAVHGGFGAAMLDSAVAIAVLSTLPPGKTFTTLELKVNYVRGLPQDGSPVTATGDVVHAGRSTATAEGRIVDEQGRLLAHATTTCLILDFPAPRGT